MGHPSSASLNLNLYSHDNIQLPGLRATDQGSRLSNGAASYFHGSRASRLIATTFPSFTAGPNRTSFSFTSPTKMN